jgi:hypothetical protein
MRKERGREVMARRGEGSNDRGWHGGDAEGIFVRTSVVRR